MTTGKRSSNSNFEIIDQEEREKKLLKRDLALKYLEFSSGSKTADSISSILKQGQLTNALDYIAFSLAASESDADNSSLAFAQFDTSTQKIVTKNLVSLLRNVNDYYKSLEVDPAKGLSKDELNTVKSIVSSSLKILLSIFADASKVNEDETQPLVEILFNLGLYSGIETFSTSYVKGYLLLAEEDVKRLLEILALMSRSNVRQTWTNIANLEDVISKLAEKVKKLPDYYYVWYLFVIKENTSSRESDDAASVSSFKLSTDFVFEINAGDEEKKQIQIINYGIGFLKFLHDSKSIFNNDLSMNVLDCITSVDMWSYDNVEDSLQDFFVEMLASFLKYAYKELLNILKKIESQEASATSSARENQPPTEPTSSTTSMGGEKKKLVALNGTLKKCLYFVEKLAALLQNYANTSTKFCIRYHKTNEGIKVLFNYLKNEYLSDFLLDNLTSKVSSIMMKNCYQAIIGSLHNLSRLNYKFKKIWDSCEAVDVCIRFSNKFGSVDEHYRFYIYMIIANIASDSQIDTLPEMKIAIKHITDLIKQCASLLEKNSTRTKIQFNEDDDMEEVIYIPSSESVEWNLVELLDALYHLSVNDNIKMDIYKTIIDHLKMLIYKGNEIEKEFSLRLLYQLCFDSEIAEDLSKSTELITYITSLSAAPDKLKRKRIVKNCDGIIWMIKLNESSKPCPNAPVQPSTTSEKNTSENEKKKKIEGKKEEEDTKPKHIMISYNRESRDVCLEIKTQLETLGYDVWIDVEDISGSSLESMAKAIENSRCVLMGMTEKYKLSSNCRLEAEYAMQLNKPIIPLILEKDYKPDGWLGIILGSKMFINFKKYSFQECIRRLKKEVENIFKGGAGSGGGGGDKHHNNKPHVDNQTNTTTKPPSENDKEDAKPNKGEETTHDSTKTSTKKLEWSEADVDKWLSETNVHPVIVNNLRPCNGKILYQLFTMLDNAPEFFYQAMRADSNNAILLKDLAYFSYELNRLFKDNH